MTQTNAARSLPDELSVLYVEDVAPMLRLSDYTTRQMAREGKIGFRKAGRRYITTLGAVKAYLRTFGEKGVL